MRGNTDAYGHEESSDVDRRIEQWYADREKGIGRTVSGLKRLVRKQGLRSPADVERLQDILRRHGYEADPKDIEWAWRQYSENSHAAGWLVSGAVSEVRAVCGLLQYLKEQDQNEGGTT